MRLAFGVISEYRGCDGDGGERPQQRAVAHGRGVDGSGDGAGGTGGGRRRGGDAVDRAVRRAAVEVGDRGRPREGGDPAAHTEQTSPTRTAGVASMPTMTAMPTAISTKTALMLASRGRRAPRIAKPTRPGI